MEKNASQDLKRDLARLDTELQQTRSERDRLGANLDSARQQADTLKTERDALSERLTSMLAERQPAFPGADRRRQGIGDQVGRPAKGDRPPAPRADASRRIAGRGQQGERQVFLRSDRTGETHGRAEGRRGAADGGAERPQAGAFPPQRGARHRRRQGQGPADVRSSISASASTAPWPARSRSWRATARNSSASCARPWRPRRTSQVVGDRFVFQSEVLFPPARPISATAASSSSPAWPSADRHRRRIPSDVNWVLQVDGHTDDGRSRRRYSRRTGNCRPRARSRW